jgi:hypothetical protein
LLSLNIIKAMLAFYGVELKKHPSVELLIT